MKKYMCDIVILTINAIEGNTLTLQETALVIEGITIDKSR